MINLQFFNLQFFNLQFFNLQLWISRAANMRPPAVHVRILTILFQKLISGVLKIIDRRIPESRSEKVGRALEYLE
jgi:hypothetical protein